MKPITKHQLTELEHHLEALKAYLQKQGAPMSRIRAVEHVAVSVNWAKKAKNMT